MTREEAIDWLKHIQQLYSDVEDEFDALIKAIEALEQTDHDGCKDCRYEVNDEFEEPCKDCKQNYTDKWTPRPKMTKNEAIAILKRHDNYGTPFDEAIEMAIEALEDRPRGEWVQNDNGTWSCSLCHSWLHDEQHNYARYCLFCGAEMRGENDG